jgi:hypothetical protein
MQSVMHDATLKPWQRSLNAKDPTDYLTSRVYWALICAQYFPKTLYLIGVNPEALEGFKSDIKHSIQSDLQPYCTLQQQTECMDVDEGIS